MTKCGTDTYDNNYSQTKLEQKIIFDEDKVDEFKTLLANNLQYLNILNEPETNVLTQTETLTKFLVNQSKQVFGKTINFRPNAKTNV